MQRFRSEARIGAYAVGAECPGPHVAEHVERIPPYHPPQWPPQSADEQSQLELVDLQQRPFFEEAQMGTEKVQRLPIGGEELGEEHRLLAPIFTLDRDGGDALRMFINVRPGERHVRL